MFGFRKKPPSNGDDSEPDKKQTQAPARASSEPMLPTPDTKKSNAFDDDDDDDFFGKAKTSTLRNKKTKSDLDSMSNQELEGYAADQAQETTKSVNNCLKIAEDIKQDASKTLDTLHAQGEQIHRTHEKAVDMEKDLNKGEKVLGNLGGMFSRTWKPKKGKMKGPVPKDDNKIGKKASKEDRQKLGLDAPPKGKGSKAPQPEAKDGMQKVELEKQKQDEALSDISDILGDLKGMASDMGSELDRQNKALDNLSDDVDEINSRVKGANQRTRKLIAK